MNYWHILAQAREALAAGRFRKAESTFAAACAAREGDARRVFLSEKLPDGARRLWRRLRGAAGPAVGAEVGRWQQAAEQFRAEFRADSETVLRDAQRQLAVSVAVDPAAAAALLATAMYLSVGSRLAARRLPAAEMLGALFSLLPASGRLCDPDLVTIELALEVPVRLRLAERALADLVQLSPDQRAVWAGAILAQLDDPRADWQPGTGASRSWLAARLADQYREEAVEVIARWQDCDEPEQPEANRRWSRLRRLEILAGRDRRRLAVPCYAEAHRLAALLPPTGDLEEDHRCREAMSVVAYRQPGVRPPRGWISAAALEDGSVLAVYWWAEEPRDVARWRPQDGHADLRDFLAAAGGRVVWHGDGPTAEILEAWPESSRGRALRPFLETVLEPILPAEGWTEDFGRRLALARSGPWRSGWRADLGHHLLAPPGHDGQLLPDQSAVEAAVKAGLLWLAVLHRIGAADPALRAGLGELARRGDPAAAFLHDHAVLGAPDQAAVDAGFAAWTLPLLWTRPDPLTTARPVAVEEAEQQDLGGQEVAVVVTGRPARVLPAWGAGERRWRVVLDRLDRLGELRRLAREAWGPVTVVPPDGMVHDLRAALVLLDDLAAAAAAAQPPDRMLAICHWIRLVETHNGDLLDVRVLRPRAVGACPLLERYAERIGELPRRAALQGAAADPGSWAAQYAQRARRSGLLIGLVDDLPHQAATLDAVWGVFDGSDASWVFLDSAAVHWRLHERRQVVLPQLHALLAGRGRRHLSLVSGPGLLREDLAAWYDSTLAVYGRPYHLDCRDARPPLLRLAGAGPLPAASLDPAAAFAAALDHLRGAGAETTVRQPAGGLAGDFWRAAAGGAFGPAAWRLGGSIPGPGDLKLVVPRWFALESADAPRPPSSTAVDSWREADRRRQLRLREQRRFLALECAALLAGPAATVEVLDGRWWRDFASLEETPRDLVAADEGIEVFDLAAVPASGEGRRAADAVAAWLADRGVPVGQLPGGEKAALADARAVRPTGVYRHDPPASRIWRDLAADLLRSWELGTPVARLLVIAERPPEGAAALAAACGAAGATVLTARPGATHGALVWARPAELAAFLAAGFEPPTCDRVLFLDLADHCPPAPGAASGARLLAWLAANVRSRLDLVGGPQGGAWARFFADRLGTAAPADDRPTGALDREPGGWSELRRGAVPRPGYLCPQCGGEALASPDQSHCRRCSYDLAGPGPRPDAVDHLPPRLERLAAQTDLGRDEPLEIWGEDAAADRFRAAAATHAAGPASGEAGIWRLPDGRTWRWRSLAEPLPTALGPALLLRPPNDPARLLPWAGRRDGSILTMLYDRLEVVPAPRGAARAGVERLLRLLDRPAWLASQGLISAPPDRAATMPVWSVAWAAGVAPDEVRTQLELLLWVAELASPAPPAVPPRPDGGAQWLVRTSLRDVEAQLAALAGRIAPALDELLADGLPGAWHLARGPILPAAAAADAPRPDAALDLLFGALAAAAARPGPRLVYAATDGAWFSSRRLVGWLGDRRELADSLVAGVEELAAAMRSALAGASHVDTGFVIAAPDRGEPPPLANRWPELLGFWSRRGAGGPRDLAVADLVRLMTAAPAGDGAGRRLLQELAAARDSWGERLVRAPVGGRVAPIGSPAPAPDSAGTPRWWRRDRAAAQRPAQGDVAQWLAGPSPARLVLAGPPGSGRLPSVLAALAASEHGRQAEFWCPDAATAVRVQMAARALTASWQPEVRLPGAEDLAARPPCAPDEPAVTILFELQRFPRVTAYQLQERARDGLLLLIVDLVDLEPGTSWEDLFLTTPHRDEVRRLREQVLQAGQVWRVTRPFLPAGLNDARGRRRERGLVTARMAGTLDECAAAIDAAVETDRLGRLIHLVAPLPEDAQLLARALGDRGWAAVRERELAPLLQSGVLEAVAGLADAHRRRHGRWPGLESAGPPPAEPWTLAGLLPPPEVPAYLAWLHGLPESVLDSTPDLLAHLRRSPWGLRCGGLPAARRKLAAFAAAATPGDVLAPAQWEAWRARLDVALGRSAPGRWRVACLASAGEPGGEPAESLAYVCFGPEPASMHRRVLARATDRLLVLYQEHSPLPDQWET